MSEIVNIRLAEKTDIPELHQLEQLSFDAESFSRRQINYLVTGSSAYFFVLTENEKIAGFIVLLYRKNTTGLRIYSLAVSSEYRGKNYGKQLIDKAVQLAVKSGKTFLYLEVNENNQRAIQLYQKKGFQLTGKRKKYYRDGSDALLMRLNANFFSFG